MVRELLSKIRDTLSDAEITKILFEGPEIIVYAKNIDVDMSKLRNLVKKIKKRVEIRADPSILPPQEEAERIIKEKFPKEAGIRKIKFLPEISKVIIEAERPGLIIGKSGTLLRELKKEIKWTPEILRASLISSRTIDAVRYLTYSDIKKRVKFLDKLGREIHKKSKEKISWIRVAALGGFREVGRSAILIQTNESNVLLDCGVNVASLQNAFPFFNVPEFRIEDLDAIVISHAHLDHCGSLPYLYRYQCDAPIYCTAPTRELMSLLLIDYIEVAYKGGKEAPFSKEDIRKTIRHVYTLNYGEVTDIAPNIRLTLYNAGHILGSGIIHLHIGEGLHNIVYTGDLKFSRTRLLNPANCEFHRVETLIIESTYGGKEDVQPPRQKAEEELARVINETIKSKGKVLIPANAVGRAQELMVLLDDFIRRDVVENVPVYLDGLIWEATAIHTIYPEFLSTPLQSSILRKNKNPFLSEFFERVGGSDERKEIAESKDPCIIIATSGMLTGGPSVEYLRWLAEDAKNSLVFVSYQAQGTLGRQIQDGLRVLTMEEEGKKISIKMEMKVHTIKGFSGHADRNSLLKYVSKIVPKPQKVIICHGESQKCLEFASAIRSMLRAETHAPKNLEIIRLR